MKLRTAIGVGLILSSFALFGAGTLVIQSAMDAQQRADRQIEATERQCIKLLNTLPNVSVVPIGDEITIILSNIVEPRKALTDASVASLMCPNKKLVEACLGDECPGAKDGEIALRMKFAKGK